MIADREINAFYVATPPGSHCALTIEALQAGKAVLVEKPMAALLADCEAMVAAAEAAGRLLFVAYYRRQDFALTLHMLSAERIDPQPMVTKRVGLDELPDAFEALRKPVDQCKVIVEP